MPIPRRDLADILARNRNPLTEFITPQPWMVEARCAEVDPEIWFPDKGGSTREAKAICRTCTVAAECLIYALEREERYGIWGGLSERERRKLKPRSAHSLRTSEILARREPVACPDCGDTFKSVSGLGIHRKAYHPTTPAPAPDPENTTTTYQESA